MVAKITRLMPFIALIWLAGCQTIPSETTETQQRRLANEPEQAQLPTAGADVSPTANRAAVENDTDSGSLPDGAINSTARPSNAAPQPESEPAAEVTRSEPDPNQVITQLQQDALQLQSEGRWAEAELILERAMRINAEKVDLYHQLATVRMGQQRFSEAEQIALKGLSLTDRTPKFKSSLWEVIAQCRSAEGNIEGAQDAREEMLKWMVAD